MGIDCGSCGTPLYHIDEACPNCLAGSRLVDRPPTFHVPPCPRCSAIDAKLDREKMAKVMYGTDTMLNWAGATPDERRSWLDVASALIKYLTK
jgi:hypothetical protein